MTDYARKLLEDKFGPALDQERPRKRYTRKQKRLFNERCQKDDNKALPRIASGKDIKSKRDIKGDGKSLRNVARQSQFTGGYRGEAGGGSMPVWIRRNP